MGSGHLMRTLTLADELRKRGADTVFVTREHPGNLIERAELAGHRVHRLAAPPGDYTGPGKYDSWLGVPWERDAEETAAALRADSPEWLVVDHYALGGAWYRSACPSGARTLVIDDLADRVHDCEMLLDQGYYGAATSRRYDGLVPADCRLLLGPRYAMVPPEFLPLRNAVKARDGSVRRVLVFFGGSDPQDQTGKAVQALSSGELAQLDVDVVLGSNHPDPDGVRAKAAARGRTLIHENLQTLADVMASADMMIGAGGGTTWERCALGIPALAMAIAENQEGATDALAADGIQVTLPSGPWTTPEQWSAAIAELVGAPAKLSALAKKAFGVTDARGAARVATAMLCKYGFRLSVRRAEPRDEQLLLGWANDAEVRARSFTPGAISGPAHASWFSRKLGDRNAMILVGEDDSGLPIGQVRFDIDRSAGEAVVDVSVDSAFRGCAMGDDLLRESLRDLRRAEPGVKPVALVRGDNHRSRRLFSRLGFTESGETADGTVRFELLQ